MLNAFKEYLSRKSSVKSQYIPYYLRWVLGEKTGMEMVLVISIKVTFS